MRVSTNRKYDALACLLVENVLNVANATESVEGTTLMTGKEIKSSTPRKGRKRKQHVYQQHRRGPSSLKFAKFKGEAINGGPSNQLLEYTLLCAITLIMEQTNQQLPSINAFNLFNDIVSKVDEFSFNLPIYLKSQDEITKELNKIARI